MVDVALLLSDVLVAVKCFSNENCSSSCNAERVVETYPISDFTFSNCVIALAFAELSPVTLIQNVDFGFFAEDSIMKSVVEVAAYSNALSDKNAEECEIASFILMLTMSVAAPTLRLFCTGPLSSCEVVTFI